MGTSLSPDTLRRALEGMVDRGSPAGLCGQAFELTHVMTSLDIMSAESPIDVLRRAICDMDEQASLAGARGEMMVAGAARFDVKPLEFRRDLGHAFGVVRRYAPVLPRHNPRFAMSQAGLFLPSKHDPFFVVSGTPRRGMQEHLEMLHRLEAPDCSPELLVSLAGEVGAVGDRARRHPSMPSEGLRKALVAGSWDAWFNEGALLVMLTAPGDDLERGARMAAADALGLGIDPESLSEERAQGRRPWGYSVPSLVRCLAMREEASKGEPRSLLDALEALWRPILGRG